MGNAKSRKSRRIIVDNGERQVDKKRDDLAQPVASEQRKAREPLDILDSLGPLGTVKRDIQSNHLGEKYGKQGFTGESSEQASPSCTDRRTSEKRKSAAQFSSREAETHGTTPCTGNMTSSDSDSSSRSATPRLQEKRNETKNSRCTTTCTGDGVQNGDIHPARSTTALGTTTVDEAATSSLTDPGNSCTALSVATLDSPSMTCVSAEPHGARTVSKLRSMDSEKAVEYFVNGAGTTHLEGTLLSECSRQSSSGKDVTDWRKPPHFIQKDESNSSGTQRGEGEECAHEESDKWDWGDDSSEGEAGPIDVDGKIGVASTTGGVKTSVSSPAETVAEGYCADDSLPRVDIGELGRRKPSPTRCENNQGYRFHGSVGREMASSPSLDEPQVVAKSTILPSGLVFVQAADQVHAVIEEKGKHIRCFNRLDLKYVSCSVSARIIVSARPHPTSHRRSSSSSFDKFEGWGDDEDEDGDEDEDEDEDKEEEEGHDHVYDWTTMDTSEGDTFHGWVGDTMSESNEKSPDKAQNYSRAKADPNPLSSKLGLAVSMSGARPVRMTSRGIPPQKKNQRSSGGRGANFARNGGGGGGGGGGRGGQPLNPSNMQVQVQVKVQHGVSPAGIGVMSTGDSLAFCQLQGRAGGRGDGGMILLKSALLPQKTGPCASRLEGAHQEGNPGEVRLVPALKQAYTANPATTLRFPTTKPSTSTASNVVAEAPPASSTTLSPMSQQICRSARTGEAYGTTCEARRSGPGGPRVTIASKEDPFIAAGSSRIVAGMGTSGVGNRPISSPRAERTGNEAGDTGDIVARSETKAREGSRPTQIPSVGGWRSGSTVVDHGGDALAMTSQRALAMNIDMSCTAAADDDIDNQKLTVKDTASITRKKAQIPQQEQLEHPAPVGGSWLKNRYIVNNYILLNPLGTGSYAEVRLAKEKVSNKLYAVKIMNKDFLKKKQVGKEGTFMDDIKREIAIMKKVHHPNVLRLYEVMDDPKVNKLYLVLEYCKKGDLMNILNGDARNVTCDPMNDTDVWYIMRQVVQGLRFLHLQNIVHGDIKPQNLLVGEDNVAKIADFGISKFVQGAEQRLHEQAGTPTFMSPELCSGGEYSGQLADVWALGATMYMIRCGKPPFVSSQVLVLYNKIQNNPLEIPPEISMSSGLCHLLRGMMEKDPVKRFALDQVVADSWLQRGDYAFPGTAIVSPGVLGTNASSRVATPSVPVSGAIASTSTPVLHASKTTGDHVFRPKLGVSLGFRPPTPTSMLPLQQQGYHAIRVSEDEVDQSINRGTTTTQHLDDGGTAPDKGSDARGGEFGIKEPGGSLPQRQHRMTPTIAEEREIDSTTDLPIGTGRRFCGGRERRPHLNETEESWKSRSFRKKMAGKEGSKFRIIDVPESVAEGLTSPSQTRGCTDETRLPSSTSATHARVLGVVSSNSDDSEELSDDPDTLYQRKPVAIEGTSSVHRGLGLEGGEDSVQSSSVLGMTPIQPEDPPSDEKFDAVMDTLAAQPRSTRNLGRYSIKGRDGKSDLTRSLPGVLLRGGPAIVSSTGESSERLGLIVAVSQRQGNRPSQEDRVKIATDLAGAVADEVKGRHELQHFALFSVFDGHNGRLSAEALAEGLHIALARHPQFRQNPGEAFVQAFDSFDRELRIRQTEEGDASGSTALVALFDSNDHRLLVANVGDSRCVASRAGVARRISNDHCLDRAQERERVAAYDGFIANNRINGVLAISRSFGDVQHKEGKSSGLIATPEVTSEAIQEDLEFVILATDGLWDVIDDQEAVNFVREHLVEDPDLSLAAKELTKHALAEGSVDNVSVVIVWLQGYHSRTLQSSLSTPADTAFSQHVPPD